MSKKGKSTESTINQRILELEEFEKANRKRLGEVTGIAYSTLSTLKKRKSNPSFGVIEAIIRAYPNLSLSWLLKGEGEMWEEGDSPEKEPKPGRAIDIEIARLKLRMDRVEEELKNSTHKKN